MSGALRRRVGELLAGPRSLLALDRGAVPAGHSPWTTVAVLPREQPVDPAGSRLADVAGDPVALLAQVAEAVEDWQWSAQMQARSAALEADAAALEPLARLLAEAGQEHGWWAPLHRGAQQRLAVEDAVVVLGDPDGDTTGPDGAGITSSLVGAVPGQAFWDWDGALRHQATRPLWRVPVPETARIFEITAMSDWVALVERVPGTPSERRRERWRETWPVPDLPVVTPDWAAVAADWDGVHLTVGAWLTARGRPAVLDGAYTLLEGWETEQTVWLNRVTGEPERVEDYAGPVPYRSWTD